jgi:two-component system response regulator NreC
MAVLTTTREQAAAAGMARAGAPAPAAQTARKIRLLLAYKHALLRQGLRLLLAAQPDIEVLGEAADGREAVEKALEMKPDVMLVDMALPGSGALEPIRTITRRLERCRVLVLTAAANEEEVVRILQSGAAGCVLKDGDARELAMAVQAVSQGGSYLSPTISQRVIGDYIRLVKRREARGTADALSPREREVLQLIAEGKGNQEIASRLCLSVKTVEAHKAHIMRKLGLRNRTELIKYALRQGIIELEPEQDALI